MEFSFGIDRQEALRYAGMRPSALPAELEPVLQNAMARIRQSAQPRVQHRMLELRRREEGLFLSTGQRLPGGDIGRTLASSHRVLLFAATLGAGVDAALRRAQAGDMTLALLMEGCASAAVESLCDRAQQALVEESGLYGTDRFSPGYGDFPLAFQPVLLSLLDAPRRMGLHVTAEHLLLPRKSVTALIGLSTSPQPTPRRGCGQCPLVSTCLYRKEGLVCDPSR